MRHADRGLEIVDDADAEQPAAPLRLLAAGGKAVPVRGFDGASEVAGEIPAVVGEPGRGAMGQLVVRDQVAAANSTRSIFSRRAAISMSRSITAVASGRPAPRNGAVGTVLVIAARRRTQAIGTS